jgi:hypothetical protein
MEAPKFEVAVEFVEVFAWFLTSALTVSLCPEGLISCQSNGEIEAILWGVIYSTRLLKLFSYVTSERSSMFTVTDVRISVNRDDKEIYVIIAYPTACSSGQIRMPNEEAISCLSQSDH